MSTNAQRSNARLKDSMPDLRWNIENITMPDPIMDIEK